MSATRPGYPWREGDALFASELNAAIAGTSAGNSGPINVVSAGADPYGIEVSTSVFQDALASGRNVFVPAGIYLITGQLDVAGSSQKLYGEGSNSILLMDDRLDPTITTGVVLVSGAMFPEVSGLAFQFIQPDDLVKTAVAASAAGTNTINVDSNTDIVVGMSVVDRTARPNAIPSTAYYTAAAPTIVTNIAGNVLTLSAAITAPGVTAGDSLQFASTRAMFRTLSGGATTRPGGSGVKYPWAIHATTAGSTRVRNVFVRDGWDGIYIRGSGFQLDKIDMGVYDIGLDIDQCYNFPSITEYRFYMFGHSVTGGPTDARDNVYNDGVTIAANLGQCDGLNAKGFQTWRGHLNLTAAWTWGSFVNLMLDGDNTNLTILGTNGAGFTQIANGYSTNGVSTQGQPVHIDVAGRVEFTNFDLVGGSVSSGGLSVFNGDVSFDNGYIWFGIQASRPMVEVFNQGTLRLTNTDLDASVGRTDIYINTSGNPQVDLENVRFVTAGGVDAVALNGGVRSLSNVQWNGWKLNTPTNILNNGNTLLAPLDASSMQAGSLSFANFGNTGHFSTAFGYLALDLSLDAATYNTAFGSQAGYRLTTGSGNAFFGSQIAMTNPVTGSNNAVFGGSAGYSLSSGSDNILIGPYVDQAALTTGSGNILIGKNLGPASGATSHTMNLGGILYTTGIDNSATALTTLQGKFALHTLRGSPGYTNDAAAAAGGVGVEEVYRNGSQLMLRVA